MSSATPQRAPATRRGEATREHILDAASQLLAERGYSGLSISRICRKADIAPTSVYWHFGSKAGLMEAVIERIGGGYVEKIRAHMAEASDPADRLDRLVAGVRDLVLRQPLGSLTGVAVLSEGRHVSEEFVRALGEARRRELEAIAGHVQAELGGSAHFARSFAILVTACANYAALTYRIERDEAQVDRILAALREAIVRLTAPSAAS